MINSTLSERLDRQYKLIGEEATKKLIDSSVIIFGVGGVGGGAAEAIARAGISKITVCDHDTIAESNINRQLIADITTIGKSKADVMAERIRNINPDAVISAVGEFVSADNAEQIISAANPDYIIDAIDTVTSKIVLIETAEKLGIPIISSMGTGNKLDPTKFRICDIYKTSVCPLARVMRKELKARGIQKLDVLFSEEEPIKTAMRTPASISFVPPAAGFIIAGHVIRKLAGI